MAEFVITYRKIRGRKEYMVIVAGEQKLLKWIGKNAGKCEMVHIVRCEE